MNPPFLSATLRELIQNNAELFSKPLTLCVGEYTAESTTTSFMLRLERCAEGLSAVIIAIHCDPEGVFVELLDASEVGEARSDDQLVGSLIALRFDSGRRPFVNRFDALVQTFPQLFA